MQALTPSVLNRSLAACVNRMLPDCMFVLTVSSGCEMNILHAPEEECEEKNISYWNETIKNEDEISYQQRRRPRNHNVQPFSLSFRQQGARAASDSGRDYSENEIFFEWYFSFRDCSTFIDHINDLSWINSTNNQIRLNTLSTVKTELRSNSRRDVNSDIKLSHSW